MEGSASGGGWSRRWKDNLPASATPMVETPRPIRAWRMQTLRVGLLDASALGRSIKADAAKRPTTRRGAEIPLPKWQQAQINRELRAIWDG